MAHPDTCIRFRNTTVRLSEAATVSRRDRTVFIRLRGDMEQRIEFVFRTVEDAEHAFRKIENLLGPIVDIESA